MSGRTRPATTRWTLVFAAAETGTPEGRDALTALCEAYWYPVYAFIRRHGHDPDEAADLAQEFFARLIEKHYLRDVRRERGRFRSFLFASVRHFLSNERDRARAIRRGGGKPVLSLDVNGAEGRYVQEPRDDTTPEMLFDRRWAVAVLERVLDRLRDEMHAGGRGAQFSRLEGLLTGDDDGDGYRALGLDLGMTEGAVKVAVHRLRRRFGELLREEVSAIVAEPEAVDAELRHLLAALSGR